jgi:aspartyl-tRNA(Asn)/glutamyl-tRNA(Gln) amidotransferase subunit A
MGTKDKTVEEILPPTISDLIDDAVFAKLNLVVLRNTTPLSPVDSPAMSLPLPGEGTLPIRLMMIGRKGGDQELFELSAGIELRHRE